MDSNNNNLTEKIEKKFLQDYRIVVSAFLAGSGILMWVLLYVFNPMSAVQKDIALIQKDIAVINLNHEQHIQDILTQLKDLKEDNKSLDEKLDLQQQAITRLLQIHNQ